MPEFRTVRGMRDFLPEEANLVRYVEATARELARLYGYREVITPVVESYELLAAKSGEEIRKRMYAFTDLGGRRVALRPEFTASIARLVATTMRNEPKPLRLFCTGSLYRYDEPQFGRYREFWQSDYELVGSKNPEADVEILTLTNDLMRKLELKNYWFKIGHVGILRGILGHENVGEEEQNRVMQLLDKKRWDEALTLIRGLKVSEGGVKTLKKVFETRGKDFRRVLKGVERRIGGYDDALSALANLREILELTSESGAEFEMVVEAGFARGLEYYTGMIFEVFVPEIDVALGGGGRYDRLVELFGGESTPAVGVAHGIDRIALAMSRQKIPPRIPKEPRVVVIPLSAQLKTWALEISLKLREAGVCAEVEVMSRTLTRALQDADRRGMTHTVLVAPEELREGLVVLRDMEKREQRRVRVEDLGREVLRS